MRRLREEGGFTIVEVMVATAILLTGVLGTLAMMNTANQRTRTASDRQGATALAREVLEAVQALNYRQVVPGQIVGTLQAADGLAGNRSASDWKIERGGTTYGVSVDVCSLDDPADGRGPRSGGGFCADAVEAGTADGSPADYKRVTVTAGWKDGSVRQSALVTSRGGGDAPAVTGLVMTSPASTPITNPATTSASFELTTSVEPDSVVWLVDGTQRGVAAPSGSATGFGFQWALPALDGTYTVEAQAFDSAAISGASKSLSVVVNRYIPSAPRGFNAGRNGAVVEAEWRANAERDIVRYRVYRRQGTGGSVLVCQTTTATECIDPNPPNPTSAALDYWVVALDPSPAGPEREGTPSAAVNVNLANAAPNAPTGLAVEPDSDGRLVLSWISPTPADPDSGDAIAFFRIYRGGTTVGDRYDRTAAGDETAFVDPKPGDGGDQYWITAVDTHLRESVLVGPVSLARPEPDAEQPAEDGQ